LQRTFKEVKSFKNVDIRSSFRIMQWNGLAKSLCNKLLEENSPTDAFDWDGFRLWRVLEELVRYDCDVICLQEADFYEDIKPYLHNLGSFGFHLKPVALILIQL
jgi:mRNA deadenylase 3'-5' endonuclease subunit Ccr4